MSMAEFFPVVFLSPLAGVLADRRNQVSVIRATQIIGGLQASLLAVLIYTGAITIEWLFALMLLLGITNSFAQPSRMALIPNLVDRPALPSALAINSIVFNSARFIGPAIAGIFIAQVSIGAAFALNAATYVVFFVTMTRSARRRRRAGRGGAQRAEGVGRGLSSMSAAIPASRRCCCCSPSRRSPRAAMSSCFPALPTTSSNAARPGCRYWSRLSGLARSAAAPGCCCARAHRADLGRARQYAGHLAGDPRLYRDRPFYVALPFVFVAGVAMVITGVGAQTLIQASVEPQMRGRVMALYGMIFRAGPALGAVLIGSLSERFGLRLPLAIGAVVSVAFAL